MESGSKKILLIFGVLLLIGILPVTIFFSQKQQITTQQAASSVQHYEYVFPDGGMYVYDMDNGHTLVKQVILPTTSGVRGVVGDAGAHALYISYGSDGNSGGHLLKYDLVTNAIVWHQTYTHGIDSMSLTPDGSKIYMPDGEVSSSPYWYVINTADGSDAGLKINGGSGPHNTIVSLNGQHVYMGPRNFANAPTYITVADTATNSNIRNIGPFKEGVRPFTINGKETLAYVTTTGFLGFQVADITSGKVIYTVDLTQLGFPNSPNGPTAPSHGIALSPDETRVAVIDWPNDYVHIFDVTGLPASAPRKVADIKFTRSMHHNESGCAYDCAADGWLEYSRDGKFLYVGDVGDVIDTTTNAVIFNISALYNTRKMIEVDWQNGVPSFIPINRASVGFVTTGVLSPTIRTTTTPTLPVITTLTPTTSLTQTLTPTINPSNTVFSITVCPHGLGNCGDNVNQNGTGNTQPFHQTRNITVTVVNTVNQSISKQGIIHYDTTKNIFTGNIDMGSLISGSYQVFIKMQYFLTKRVPGIIIVTRGKINKIPFVALVTGDMNDDNQLDISDYNILLSCYGDKQHISSCINPVSSDIDDNGVVDGADYNLFLRELSVQQGDSFIGGAPTPTR